MKNKSKRKEFEKAEWTTNPIDCLPENPKANKECKSCRGHGIVDAGYEFGCILENCPDCWKK